MTNTTIAISPAMQQCHSIVCWYKMMRSCSLTKPFSARVKLYSLSTLAVKPKQKHLLTSKIVGTTDDGIYPWNVIAFLGPHESLRREMQRGHNAIRNFNLATKPWQAYCFAEWFEHFLKTTIKEHDDVEDNVTFGYYKDLGVDIPSRHTADHELTADLFDNVTTILGELKELAETEEDNQKELKARTAELRTVYTKLTEFMGAHFEAEERFWPIAIERYGELKYHALQEHIGKYSIQAHPDSCQLLICASLHCMGIKIKDSLVEPEADEGWAGEALKEQYLKFMDPSVKNVILPEWNKKYTAMRVLIDSCSLDTDIMEVNSKIAAVMA